MGTIISLDLAGLSVSWSKNSRGPDHGALFQEIDRTRAAPDQIEQDAGSEDSDVDYEAAFVRSLSAVLPRLELLGYTLDRVRAEYLAATEYWREERASLEDEEPAPGLMSFEEFRAFIVAHPVAELSDTPAKSLDEDEVRGRFAEDPAVRRLPGYSPYHCDAYSERSYFGSLITILDPYSVLRLLAENEKNLGVDVEWRYGALVENGWATWSEFEPNARRRATFLIATEGSSDAHILKRAIQMLRPDVVDFFRFIDVSESHPFPGAGNLLKFADGLAKIDVHNQVVFLFDNDAEGLDAHRKLAGRTLPINMRGLLLPDLEDFRSFPARGPEGVHCTDINGRAAAIECYLDLDLPGRSPAQVLWTNYKEGLNAYHGALEFKDSYMKHFLKQTAATLADGSYDARKLHRILNMLLNECSEIAAQGARPEDANRHWRIY
jgi:hypothetical protein